MAIVISPANWGNAKVIDLQKVLNSVTEILDLYFDSTIDDDVLVEHNPSTGPIVLYDRGPNNEYQVKLSTKDLVWDQHSYQFAHEYCHIRTNYKKGNQKCKWFEETICELASLFTLRRMSEKWAVNPPYSNWLGYATSLFKYAENRIIDDKHKLPVGLNFQSWFQSAHADLKKDPYIRESNTLIAIKLLKLFEENTELWAAMKYYNTWDVLESDNIYSNFSKWLALLPNELKPGVNRLIDVFRPKT
jgi:hypothetical protein